MVEISVSINFQMAGLVTSVASGRTFRKAIVEQAELILEQNGLAVVDMEQLANLNMTDVWPTETFSSTISTHISLV